MENLKKSDDIEIIFKNTLANSPCLPLFLRCYAEIIEKKFAMPLLPFGNKSRVVYAKRGDEILGGIVYHLDPDIEVMYLISSFVDEKYRGQRIFYFLMKELETYARSINFKRITTTVHKDNTSRLAAGERVGMKTEWYSQVIILD